MPLARPRVLLVSPQFPPSFWSFGYIKHIGGFRAVMPPLGLAILGALTPPEFDVAIVDENIEVIDFDAPCATSDRDRRLRAQFLCRHC